jgi:MFS family permease
MSKNSRLGTMMFLQYALWGAWLPVTARYLSASVAEGGLGFSGSEIGMILGLAGSIGAVAAPFIAGQIADRYFSTERILAALVIIGGVVKWITAYQTDYSAWLVLSIIYSVVYMPTLALSNSITFRAYERS